MNFTRLLKTAMLGAMLGAVLLAQGPPAGPMGPGMGRGAGMMGMFGPARQDLLFGYLGLSDAQKTQAQAIFTSARTAAQPITDQLKQARTGLEAAIKAGQPVQTLATTQGNLMGQLIAIHANAQEQFRAILTPDQLAKLDQFHANRATNGPMSRRRQPANN